MARAPDLNASGSTPVIVRAAAPESEALLGVVFRRYPSREWVTFARFGWRDTPGGLVLTLAALDSPTPGDVDESVGNVAIDEAYTLRVALVAESHNLAVGVIHSHPAGARPLPSLTDDDMDRYYSDYFGGFAPGRPYVSLIVASDRDELYGSGRIFWKGEWHKVTRFVVQPTPVRIDYRRSGETRARGGERVARLRDAFGDEAAERLASATVAVIGASGTGSPAIEILARAGVGRLIVVDPDVFVASNLERIHGSMSDDVESGLYKVDIARRHILSINPECDVTAIRGALPQREVVDALVAADAIIGATDSQHSRLALSDIALRYLVPAIDCGVALEGGSGRITGQVIQLVRFLPADPCALCRRMTVPWRVAQELMSEDERKQRRAAAAAARERGNPADHYWHDVPQLNTVGYLTTTAGAMAAGYVVGWVTGRFVPPFSRLQMNLAAPFFDVTDVDEKPRPDCPCRRVRGMADQAIAEALITAPTHWPRPQTLGESIART